MQGVFTPIDERGAGGRAVQFDLGESHLPEQRGGPRHHLRPPARDVLAGRGLGDHLARGRDPDRRDLGRPAEIGCSTARRWSPRLAFISAPGLLARTGCPLPVRQRRGRDPHLPRHRLYNDAETFTGKIGTMILPWLVLASATAAIYARYVRAQMIDVMTEDYIRTARAKGLSERRVIVRKHGLRSALTPIVTLLGLDIGVLLAGNAILTETVFNIPGVGSEVSNADRRVGPAADPGHRPLRRLLHRHLQPDRRHRSTPTSIRGCATNDRAAPQRPRPSGRLQHRGRRRPGCRRRLVRRRSRPDARDRRRVRLRQERLEHDDPGPHPRRGRRDLRDRSCSRAETWPISRTRSSATSAATTSR